MNAHGSSTPLNDSTETRVIREVLGEHADRAAVSGTKGYHAPLRSAPPAPSRPPSPRWPSSAAGSRPPSTSRSPTPAATSPTSAAAGEERAVRHAISNSFGFGGINAALVFGGVGTKRSFANYIGAHL